MGLECQSWSATAQKTITILLTWNSLPGSHANVPFTGAQLFHEAFKMFDWFKRSKGNDPAQHKSEKAPQTAQSAKDTQPTQTAPSNDPFPEVEQELLQLMERNGANHESVGDFSFSLACKYANKELFSKARPHFERALEIWQNTQPQNQAKLADTLLHYGAFAEKFEFDSKAEQLFEQLFKLDNLESCIKKVDQDFLSNMVEASVERGQIETAKRILKRDIALKTCHPGAHNEETINSMKAFLNLCFQNAEIHQAIEGPMIEAMEKMTGQAMPPENRLSFMNLCDAEAMWQRVVEAKAEQKGWNEESVVGEAFMLASLREDLGMFEEAEALYLHLLKAVEDAEGVDSIGVSYILNNLCGLYVQQEKFAKAAPLIRRACAIRAQFMGDDHPETQGLEKNLCIIMMRLIDSGALNVKARAIDDPELLAANQEARKRWPEFVSAFENRQPNHTFTVKAAFTDGALREHMWMEVTAVNDLSVSGKLDNDPQDLKNMKSGDIVQVGVAAVEDWEVSRGVRRIAGGFTTDVLIKRAADD